jgi:hypothetical protein
MMQAVRTFETSVYFNEITRLYYQKATVFMYITSFLFLLCLCFIFLNKIIHLICHILNLLYPWDLAEYSASSYVAMT